MNRTVGDNIVSRRRKRLTLAPLTTPQRANLPLLDSILSDPAIMGQDARVLGPYKEGQRYRLCVYKGSERVKSLYCGSLDEAEQMRMLLDSAIKQKAARTIGDTITEYIEAQTRAGLKPNSLRTVDYRLRLFLPPDMTLGTFTAERADDLYLQETERYGRYGKPLTAASHRATLKTAKVFFRWVVGKKYLKLSPFEHVKPVGRVNSGKPQLRLAEARKLNDWLIRQAETGDEGATACLMQLVLGLRSSEVLSRHVRDVDNAGTELWIEGGKTRNARRRLEIQSKPLQQLLLKQIAGRHPDQLLFGGERSKPFTSPYLWKRLQQYCRLAGVPKVCPHSMRGLHSTIAIEKGATSGLVAAALGHSSFAITARHYVEPSALENTYLRKVSAALDGSAEEPTSEVTELASRLQKLEPAQLAALLASVEKRD